MESKQERRRPFEEKIPEDVRQHMRAARDELRESIKLLLPPEFVAHRRRARREMLLAWRGMIDSALQRIEEREKKVD